VITRAHTYLHRSAKDFGCIFDGTTDNAVRFQAALDAGPGTVELPPVGDGVLGIADPIDVPSGVNLIAPGGNSHGAAMTIKALTADACLNFGERLVGSYGGVSGGFMLDGNSLAPTMLYLGRTLERVFQAIGIKNCAAGSAALLIEEAQNNQFYGLYIDSCEGDGICFNRGTGGGRFYGVESTEIGGTAGGGFGGAEPAHVRFTATDASVSGLVAWPLNQQFWGGIFERDGGAADALVYHGAGADNAFWGVNLAGGAPSRAFPLVKMEVGNAGITTQSTRLHFWGGYFTGSQTQNTVLDLDDGSIVFLYGNPLIQGFLNQYRFRDTLSRVYRVGNTGVPAPSGVTNTVSGDSVGTISQEQVLLDKLTVTNLAALHQTAMTGDNNTLFYVEKANGTDVFGVNTNSPCFFGTNAADLRLFSGNSTGEVYHVDGATGIQYFGAAGTSTVSVRTGAGSPEGVVTAPIGSLYLRTDGGVGSTLYSKESGTGNTGWGAR
jgi:hypothetical protein